MAHWQTKIGEAGSGRKGALCRYVHLLAPSHFRSDVNSILHMRVFGSLWLGACNGRQTASPRLHSVLCFGGEATRRSRDRQGTQSPDSEWGGGFPAAKESELIPCMSLPGTKTRGLPYRKEEGSEGGPRVLLCRLH